MHGSIFMLLLPYTCIAHTIAIWSHDYCAIFTNPPTPDLYGIHHTLSLINTATIPFFTEPLSPIPWSRFSGTFLALPINILSAYWFSLERLKENSTVTGSRITKWQKVPENRDQGIGLNGTVKTKSLPCSLLLSILTGTPPPGGGWGQGGQHASVNPINIYI